MIAVTGDMTVLIPSISTLELSPTVVKSVVELAIVVPMNTPGGGLLKKKNL